MQQGVTDDPGGNKNDERENGENCLFTVKEEQKAEGSENKWENDGAGEGC